MDSSGPSPPPTVGLLGGLVRSAVCEGEFLDAGVAALEGQAMRLALRRAALQPWWLLPSAVWMVWDGAASGPGVVGASMMAAH